MHEVLVLCEGHTEREFCKRVIAPYLAHMGVGLKGTMVGNPQKKQGGVQGWPVYRKELIRLARERKDRHLAVLVDYFRMPHSWPGRETAPERPITERGLHVENALLEDLGQELDEYFHPCVQLHEFESLLFVDPERTAKTLSVTTPELSPEKLSQTLSSIKAQCEGNVEKINNTPEKAPSKRISEVVPNYDKVAWGIFAVEEAGLDSLRTECPWLDRWLERMESLGRPS